MIPTGITQIGLNVTRAKWCCSCNPIVLVQYLEWEHVVQSLPVQNQMTSMITTPPPVTHGTRVNIITHLPTAEIYGPGMSSFCRAGVDGLTLLYERHPAQLVIELRYDSPYVEDAINNGNIPLSYSHFPLPIIGYLFNLDGIPPEMYSQA
jgi:hypothetical protein